MLTEGERLKIEQEEIYRQQVRQRVVANTPKKPSGCLKMFVIIICVLLTPIFLSVMLNTTHNSSPSTTTQISSGNTSKVSDVKVVAEGTLLSQYKYTVVGGGSDSRYVASFEPFLPNKDSIVLEAYGQVATDVYGKHLFKSYDYVFEPKGTINAVRMTGMVDNGKYYFYTVKEDTGEIHSLVFWKE